MKTFITLLFLLCYSQAFCQFAPEPDPKRGMYIDKFVKTDVYSSSVLDPAFSVLAVDENKDGIFEKEDALLKYASANHITYLALYDLHRIIGRNFMVWDENLRRKVDLEDHLDRFLRKAKSQFGITQLGAIGGSVNFFDSLSAYMKRHPLSDFDVVNIEYEFWLACAQDFPNYIPLLEKMQAFEDSFNLARPSNPIISEVYLAYIYGCNSSFGSLPVVQTIDGCSSCSPCATCPNPHSPKADRIKHAWFVSDPGTINIAEQNFFENSLTQDSTDFHPILYSESYNTGGTVDWTGVWFPLSPYNNIFTAEESYYSRWRNNLNVAFGTPRQNNVQPGGVHWFTATNMVGHLDNPQILQNTGPYCTSNPLQEVTFNYYGPIENNIPFQFWITRDDDSATVYPYAGGRINGVSGIYQPLTPNTSLIKNINFSDTTIFPECVLPEGNYTAHLLLNYSDQFYQCNNNLIIDNAPRIEIVGDSAFCEGKYTYLHVNEPATSFSWYKNNSLIPGSSAYYKVTEDGDYSCTITGGGCPGNTDTVHIHVLPNPRVDVNAVCNGNGTATLKTNLLSASPVSSTVSGRGGVTYRWNNGDTTDQLIVTPPSSNTTYRVNVTNPYNGCTRTAQIILNSPLQTPYASNIIINNQPSSPCSSDGSITVNLSSSPNNYLWSNGATTQTISGLLPGTYSVAMNVWARGCTTFDSVTIGIPSGNGPNVIPVIQNSTCNNSADGSIQLTVTGGNSPFTYHWINFPEDSVHHLSDKDQSILFPGFYTIRITDASGCAFEHTFTIAATNASPVIETLSTTPVAGCPTSSNGSATVTSVTGGTQPYIFLWMDSQQQTGVTASALPAGSVEVIVTDAHGCKASAFASIASVQLPLNIHLLDSSNNFTSCPGDMDGNLYLNITGGTMPYTVSSPWSADSNFAMQNNLQGGIYPIQITDADGCVLNDSFMVRSPDSLNLFSNANPATCIGCQNGSIAVSFTGGTAPFQISWLPSTGTLTGNHIDDLAAGIYSICVTDKFGCSACIQDTITENPQGIFSPEMNSSISVIPNPFSEYTTIEIQNLKTFSGSIAIYDAANIRVQYSKVFTPKFIIDNQNLTPGIYFLKIWDKRLVLIGVKKLIIF